MRNPVNFEVMDKHGEPPIRLGAQTYLTVTAQSVPRIGENLILYINQKKKVFKVVAVEYILNPLGTDVYSHYMGYTSVIVEEVL